MELIKDNYSIYNNDCMYLVPNIPDNSIDLSIYSPPFAGLYNYSSSENDFSNCESAEEFLQQYEYLIKEMGRITKPGRINAVHITEIINQNGSNYDFPHDVIKLHEKYGFEYKNRITVWKEPLKVRMRTMVKSLMHKLIVEDATQTFTAMPDYILIFRKKGDNLVPVTHSLGFSEYYGSNPLLPEMIEAYGNFEDLKAKYKNWTDPRTNKLSHIIWQRYASSVWDDVRIDNVLPFKESREGDDEKHVHPLQLDIIQRLVELYSNKNEIVFTPFMGVGSEVYGAVKLGRKAIGVELKESYYKQAVMNMNSLESELKTLKNNDLFDFVNS